MFFFQFLEAGDRWQKWLSDGPLAYLGHRGSGKLNVMGTAMLSILCGHWRWAHINSVRGDAINAGRLGMQKILSEDVVRTALKRMDEAASLRWVQRHILASISPALNLPWILDVDTTIKCLYGHQEGSQIGYNPRQPGRPCHLYHSYFVANLRISLGVESATRSRARQQAHYARVLDHARSSTTRALAHLRACRLTRSRRPSCSPCGPLLRRSLPHSVRLRPWQRTRHE